MTPEQDQAIEEKMTDIGYPDFDIMPGEDEILMLYIKRQFICSVDYALSLPDEQLKALIVGALQAKVVQ